MDANFARLLFMEEFKVIDSAPSVEALRTKLKDNVFDRTGPPFEPKGVQDALPKYDQHYDATTFETMKVNYTHSLTYRDSHPNFV